MENSQSKFDRSLVFQHWIHWLVNLLAVTGVGVFLLTLVRSQPEAIHKFASALENWQRHLFVFVLCVLLTFSLFLTLPDCRSGGFEAQK